ncbi:MAG: aldo/keto reductase [Elusimicrobia bacterium]|nr:aldo/keto reductase [Elusimicrobiota bacterium]
MKTFDLGERSGLKVPRVNIGGMRLPADYDDAVDLIRHAIDSGMRYIDTSRGYGESEWIIGRALKNGYRKKVILSTKSSPWVNRIRKSDNTSSDSIRRRIDESLKRLDTDYLDYYQVWNINSRECYNNAVAKGGMVDGIKKAMKEGLVKRTGFTTHDSVENLMDYIKEVDWCDIILFSYNLLNRKYAPVIEAARKAGIGTLVMNPVGGGKLAESSSKLKKLAREVGATSETDLAIRYVLSNPNVDTILCGMTKLSDVDSTISSAEKSRFGEKELKKIDGFIDNITEEGRKFCSRCKYCLPCPKGIDIPQIMNIIFDYRYWGFKKLSQKRYKDMKGSKAGACSKCGKCEKACTQKLSIMSEMTFAANKFGE